MSVQMNTYVLIGDVFDYAKLKDRYDELEPYMDDAFYGIHHHKGLCVIYDGMNGRYVAIGRVLAKTRDGEGFDAPVQIPLLTPDAEERAALAEQIAALAGQAAQVRHLVISHYR
jgi:hypothetical protein